MEKRKLLISCLILALLFMPLNVFAVNTPNTPTGLKATVVSSTQVSLTWDSVINATQYYVYRATQFDGDYTYIGASISAGYLDNGLSPNTQYYYKVQAINSAGASPHSAVAWVVTLSGSGNSVNTSDVSKDRLADSDRYATAAEIAKAGWDKSNFAVIASGENYPDALCASPLAAKYNAPILLTTKNTLQTETKKQLLALGVKEVFLIGGTGVVSEKVVNEIRDLDISVTRLAGDNRYETSLKVAEKLGDFNEAVIASGMNFQDVLSIAPIAAQEGIPILLTPKDSISAELKTFLNKMVQNTYVLGDVSSISNNVYNQLPSPERLTGTSWYDLNINILKFFIDKLDLSTCYVAIGTAYPDALAGSVLASKTRSPVILVSNPLSKVTEDYFKDYSSQIRKVIAFGGTGVIPDGLLTVLIPKTDFIETSNNLIRNLTATPISASQINLSWDPVNNATAYNVFKSTSFSGNYEKIATVTSTNYSDNYLSTASTYYYKVQAVFNTGTGPFSDVVVATTLTLNSALTQPNNVKATLINSNQVNLTWDTVSSALYYNVFRATAINGTYINIASVNTPYYTDTNLVSGTTYYYKIQAVNSYSASPYSNVVQVQAFLDNNILATPTNVVATPLSPSQIHVKWDNVQSATVYNVYRSNSMIGTYDLVASVTTPFHVDTNLSSNTMYFYKIQAGNSVGLGNYSEVVYARTQYSVSTLGTPTNLKALPLSSSQIFITWEAVNGASYYNIYRAISANGAFTKVSTVDTPYYTDEGLSAKTTYYYKIQAGNNTTTGSQSSIVSGTTTVDSGK